MACPSGTQDLPTTPQGLPFFLVKISKVKYKIVNDYVGRIITITFTLNKQNFHITTLWSE